MLKRIWSLIIKEFLAAWRDPKSRILIIVPPIVQLIIFANAATMEVKNISTVVFDDSKSYESRELISGFEGSPWFKKIIFTDNRRQMENLIASEQAQLGIIINNDFAAKIKSRIPAEIQVIVDGRQTNSAAIISGYASKIIAAYEQRVHPERYRSVPSITIEVRHWFNPNLSYQWYTVSSMIAILSAISALVLTAMSIAREHELGTFDQIIVSPLSSFEILLGKTIPPVIIAMAVAVIITFCAVLIFELPFKGSVFWFILSLLVYLMSIVGIGLFVSSICKTQQQAILGAFSFLMPSILISGYVSPIADMPQFLQNITLINPVRYYLIIAKGILLKDMAPADIWQNMLPLFFIALGTLSIAAWTFKKKLG